MTYLSIDPGTKSTGWAWFDDLGNVTGFGKVVGSERSGSDGVDAALDWLDEQPIPDVLIFENYQVNPNVPHAFSKVRTVEVIGGIKRWARKNNVTLVEQRNVVLPIGLRYVGMYNVYYTGRKRIKHVDDEISALAHGEYYLVKNKIKKHRGRNDSSDV